MNWQICEDVILWSWCCFAFINCSVYERKRQTMTSNKDQRILTELRFKVIRGGIKTVFFLLLVKKLRPPPPFLTTSVFSDKDLLDRATPLPLP